MSLKVLGAHDWRQTASRKVTLTLKTLTADRVHRSFKIIALNANGNWRQRNELSKQLQDLHIDV
jgi:hypothetical protein